MDFSLLRIRSRGFDSTTDLINRRNSDNGVDGRLNIEWSRKGRRPNTVQLVNEIFKLGIMVSYPREDARESLMTADRSLLRN